MLWLTRAAGNMLTGNMQLVTATAHSDIPAHYKLTVTIDGTDIPMEVDTGSSVTLLNSRDFNRLGGEVKTLKPSTLLLKSYSGDLIKCLGDKEMCIQVGNQEEKLVVRVVETSGPSLLGRDLMSKVILPWQKIFNVTSSSATIIQEYPKSF
jgi:hypothetical protein